MNPDVVATKVQPSASERSRFPRYRYSAPLVIRPANAPEMQGMVVEISVCGMSAVTSASLQIGDLVEAEPLAGGVISAIVRRRFGRFCGFEFLHLSAEQAGKIMEMCRMLPQYRSKTLDLWQP